MPGLTTFDPDVDVDEIGDIVPPELALGRRPRNDVDSGLLESES